jgi:hypothetical protein
MSSKYLKSKELEWLLRRASCDWRESDVNLPSIRATSWLAMQLWIINGHENMPSLYLTLRLEFVFFVHSSLSNCGEKKEHLDVSIFHSLIG